MKALFVLILEEKQDAGFSCHAAPGMKFRGSTTTASAVSVFGASANVVAAPLSIFVWIRILILP